MLATVTTYVCVALSFLLMLSPLPASLSIIRKKTLASSVDGIPLAMMWIGYLIGFEYGYCAGDSLSIFVSLCGIIISGCYNVVLILFSNNYQRQLKLVSVLTFFAIMLYFAATHHKGSYRFGDTLLPIPKIFCWTIGDGSLSSSIFYIGLTMNALTILLSSSPLLNIMTVLKYKDSSSLPILFLIMNTLACLSWGFYGLYIRDDVFVYFPNIISFVISVIQIILWFVYYKQQKYTGKKKNS